MSTTAHRFGFPLRSIYGLCLVLTTLSALLPWIRSFITYPHEPLTVSVLFRDRAGDIEYFPLIAQLARGTVTDQSVRERSGEFVRTFPWASLAPYALSVALFGKVGWIFADVLIALGYFLLCRAFFRAVGTRALTANLSALALVLGIVPVLSVNVAIAPFGHEFRLVNWLWGMRIPRPHAAELLLVMTLLAIVQCFRHRDLPTLRHWLFLAVSLALLLQADVHSFLGLGLALLVVAFVRFRPTDWLRMAGPLTLAASVAAILLLPFLYQRLHEHPDIAARWGRVTADRLWGLRHDWKTLVDPLGGGVAMWMLAWATHQLRPREDTLQSPPDRRTGLVLFATVCSSAWAKVLTILLLGFTIQPYHFDDRAPRIASYAVLGFVLLLAEQLVDRVRSRWAPSSGVRRFLNLLLRPAFAAGMLFGYNAINVVRQPALSDNLRSDIYPAIPHATASFRASFAELATFLDRQAPAGAVLATFDLHAMAWWMTFRGDPVFNPHAFVSNLPDREIERRLISQAHRLGLDAAQFQTLLQTHYINLFYLGSAKYLASSLHTFAPLDDYTPAQRESSRSSNGAWQLLLPPSELARLDRAFHQPATPSMEPPPPDLMVLRNAAPEADLQPVEAGWRLTFQNDAFRVYARSH